jgi:hypothetical protein
MSPDYLADVLIRNCVGYCLDAEDAAITLLPAAKTLQPEAFLKLAEVVEELPSDEPTTCRWRCVTVANLDRADGKRHGSLSNALRLGVS